VKTYEIPSFFFYFILTFRKNLESKVFSIARHSAWLNFWEPSQTLAILNYWKAKLSNSPSLDLLEFPPLDVFHNFCDDFLDEISGCFFFLKFLFKKKKLEVSFGHNFRFPQASKYFYLSNRMIRNQKEKQEMIELRNFQIKLFFSMVTLWSLVFQW